MSTGWGVWVAIALGSAAGGVLRQALTEGVTLVVGAGLPWGTWLVNVIGSAAIGGVSAAVALGVPSTWSLTSRHAVMTGLLGGFTTFSTFSIQAVALCQQGRWAAATAYVALSVAVSLVVCWGAFLGIQQLAR